MIAPLMNHLWQSTLFALAAAIAAAALRKNGAHIRHGVWVVASLKFLAPFSLLLSLGAALPTFTPAAAVIADRTTAAAPALPLTADRFAQPFTSDDFMPAATLLAPASTTNWTLTGLFAIWMIGVLSVAWKRIRGWRRIRAVVRQSTPVELRSPIPVRSSPGLLEPGVVGIRCPVLLVPAGIEQRLTRSQLDAVFAHELCHVHRRDNLTAAIHMVVEAVFWFHPLVWWIGARMIEERERACDEYVLRALGEPQSYAESILNVCKLYVESPLACVSGVNGSDLKKRVAAIMVNRIGTRLNLARKAALTLAAVLAVVLPLLVGMLTSPIGASVLDLTQGVAATMGQSPSAKFDVVSIKVCSGSAPSRTIVQSTPGFRSGAPWQAQTSPGYVYWDCVTLAQLVEQAYVDSDHPLLNSTPHPQPDPITRVSRQPKRIRGGPLWVETDKFTIEAKASVDVTDAGLSGRPSRNLATLPGAMSQALRAMLEDRFQLKVRRVQEQQDLYALKIAKGGLNKQKVTKPTPGDCITIDEYSALAQMGQEPYMPKICGRMLSAREGLIFSSYTLQKLAEVLSSSLDRFVVDQTGVDGLFNFALLYPEDGTRGYEFFIRALEQLGMKIETTKGPAEYLLIESVQRPKPNTPDADALLPPSHAQGPARKPR